MPLENRTNQQLMTMLHNTISHEDRPRALAAKNRIYAVWAQRNQKFLSGEEVEMMDADGVLSAFGYHVGDNGITNATKRHVILNHVLEAPIPPIKDKEYTIKWGRPQSIRRAKTLVSTLYGLVQSVRRRNAYNQTQYQRAMTHWQEDIAYLENLPHSSNN